MTRLNTKKAAERLGMTPDGVLKLAALGYLVGATRSGTRGPGKRLYFDSGEVEAFAKGGAPAAQAYRDEQQGSPATARRGRKVPA